MRAIVTGGTRGIGAGIAKAFVASGATVVICGREEAAGQAAAHAIAAAGEGTCQFVACDVRSSQDNERLVATALEHLGGLDCLVNNAGWHPPHRPIDDIAVAELVELLRLNVVSYFEVTKLALPAIRDARGCVINVGSLVGGIGQVHASDYVISKAAIAGLTRALAIDEARHGVRVNTVVPGVVETPSHLAYLEAQDDPGSAAAEVNRWQWLARIGRPEEVGHLCCFLASQGAAFITGATIPVSGGAELGYGAKAGWVSTG